MKDKGVLTVISGFSGTGKGTVVKKLVAEHEDCVLSISYTTRAPRSNEVHGVHYYFTTDEEFEKMIAEGAFVEHAGFLGGYYGTPKAFVEEQLAKGKHVILEIEVQGALQVKEKNPDCNMIFLVPPTAEELKRRLVGRGTETMEKVQSRLERAVEEADLVQYYDYTILNDDLDQCVAEVYQLITGTLKNPEKDMAMVQRIKEELKVMLKGE